MLLPQQVFLKKEDRDKKLVFILAIFMPVIAARKKAIENAGNSRTGKNDEK